MKNELLKKIEEKSAVVGIVGLGYVGLPLGLVFCQAGFRVLGFDIDPVKVESIRRKESYIAHIDRETIARAVNDGKLDPTTDFSRAVEADAIIICVPTPLSRHREPDLSFVISTMETLAPFLRPVATAQSGKHHLSRDHRGGTPAQDCLPGIYGRPGFPFWCIRPKGRIRPIPATTPGPFPRSAADIPAPVWKWAGPCTRPRWKRWCLVSSTKVAELTKLLEEHLPGGQYRFGQ